MPMICADPRLRRFAASFRACFSQPQFQYFVTVLLAVLLCTGLKSNCWVWVADATAPGGGQWQRLSDYYQVLSAAGIVR